MTNKPQYREGVSLGGAKLTTRVDVDDAALRRVAAPLNQAEVFAPATGRKRAKTVRRGEGRRLG
jgi:hypothetical protein